MDNKELTELYSDGYRREHSIYLKDFFSINPNGVDYHTPNNIAVEFKESFMKDRQNIWFKVPKSQCDVVDLIVFSIHNEKYYVLDKKDIQENFSFKTYNIRANIRINTVKLLSIFKTKDILELKQFLDDFKK